MTPVDNSVCNRKMHNVLRKLDCNTPKHKMATCTDEHIITPTLYVLVNLTNSIWNRDLACFQCPTLDKIYTAFGIDRFKTIYTLILISTRVKYQPGIRERLIRSAILLQYITTAVHSLRF